MSKEIIYGVESRDALKRGVDKLANAVKVTLGAKGRNVVIDKQYGSPIITKDGVTVAKEIDLKDPIENMGAQMVKEVASRTADVAGDGTTTATVLAQAIVVEGLKNVAAGANPMDIKRGIDDAVKIVVESLKKQSKKIGDDNTKIEQIATISANNDSEIGKLIAVAMEKVKQDGVITVEEAKGTETTVEIVEGMQLDRGYISPYFVTDAEKMTVEFDNPIVILYDKKISTMTQILPILEKIVKEKAARPILIIAEDVDASALTFLVANKLKGGLAVAAVKAPGFGDRRKALLEDMAVLMGATLISVDGGYELESAETTFLGSAEKIIITKDTTTIVSGGGKKEDIKSRVKQLQTQIESCTSEYDKEKLQERLAKLAGGVAVLYVGASTELEMKEKKDRIDDALHATRAAVAEGIIPGGGVAFIRAQKALEKVEWKSDANADFITGHNIVKRAIEEPLRQMCINAGVEGAVVVQKVREGKGDFGYNVLNEVYESLYEAGVIDPTKVARVALENAASIAGMLLTTECLLSEIKDDKAVVNEGGNGMM